MRLKLSLKAYLIVGGLLAVIILSVLGFQLTRSVSTVRHPVKIARVDLDALVQNHPNWQKYLELKKEIDKLQQKWQQDTAQGLGQGETATAGESEESRRQVDKIQQMFNAEDAAKRQNLQHLMQEFSQKKIQGLNAGMKQKLDELNSKLAAEIKSKSASLDAEFGKYQNQVQAEYQITLTNLQLQLSLAEMSADKKEVQLQTERINQEIEHVKQEMYEKLDAKKQLLQKEMQNFSEQRKNQIGTEIDTLKKQLQKELDHELLNYKKKIEAEYESWRKQRNKENDAAIKLRQSDLKQDDAKRLIIQSQLNQIKDDILWDIKQKTKSLARQQKIDCVLIGEIANNNLLDLTYELRQTIQKMN